MNALLEAYFFYDIKRFDIKGKEFLRTLGKYYIVDIGLRNYLLGFRDRDSGHAIENVVYFELLRRDYDVSIGKVFYPQLGVKLCSMAGGGVQKIYMVFLREPSRRDRSGSDLFHLRDGFEIKMNFDRNVSCFIFVNALMHDDFFD